MIGAANPARTKDTARRSDRVLTPSLSGWTISLTRCRSLLGCRGRRSRLETIAFIANWLSLVTLAAAVVCGLAYRIRVDERALLQDLGEDYRNYAATHKRLVPFIGDNSVARTQVCHPCERNGKKAGHTSIHRARRDRVNATRGLDAAS
jgi:hypothetical protein